jgi:hypothetical protein
MPTGHLGTWTFGTTGPGLNVIDIEPPKEEVDDIELPHLALAKGDVIPKEAGELTKVGRWKLTLADDNNTHIADQAQAGAGAAIKKIRRLPQTMTWTKPVPAGLTNGATKAFSGYVASSQEGPQQTGQRSTIVVEITQTGNQTITVAS